MNQEKFADMKDAYALGALTPEETRDFESYLAEHPEYQPEVDELAGLASLFAMVPVDREPPKSLRKNLMKTIHDEGGVRRTSRSSRRGLGAYVGSFVDGLRARPLALGAAGLIVVGLFSWNVVLQGQVQSLRGDNSDLQAQIESPAAPPEVGGNQVLAMASEGEMSGVEAEVVSYEGGRAVLVAHNVPQIPEEETFQIWVIQDGEASPSGLFEPQNGAEAPVAAYVDGSIANADAIAVTVEPEGGSEQPTSDPQLQASL
ncbi:anti-sigma factor [Rubrobacter indicoceani]|uniref:anti-sigma factor n=1 Tax=Rubrobacter indicoceani TaxID=2051957 RepID=UPI0013C4AD48|nr:anti-sigma factor [Rubrobacter indicoceani]